MLNRDFIAFRVGQTLMQPAHNRQVAGPSPAEPAIFINIIEL